MSTFKHIALAILILVGFSAAGQENIKNLLLAIEENSPRLAAIKAQTDFMKAEVRADLLPANPEIEGGRFPAMDGAGIKYTWGVSQHFEFPTVYAKRNQLAKTTDKFANANYLVHKQEVLLDAKLTILEIIYTKQLLAEHRQREALSQKVLAVVQKMVDTGQATAMDLNNARLRLAEAKGFAKEISDNISILSSKLIAMNGNKEIGVIDSLLILSEPPKKDQLHSALVAADPRFVTLETMVEQSQAALKLERHKGLPELSIGFESEKTDAEHFAGFRAGLTIPLWGNVGKRRAATINHTATQLEKQSQLMQLEADFENLYNRTISCYGRLIELKQAATEYNNITLIQKALQHGQVSVIDFYNEVTFLYSVTDKVLELELEYAKLYAELHRFEL